LASQIIGLIQASQIGSVNAATINVGSLRGINLQAGNFMLLGSFLTSATAGADAVINVDNNVDFSASGSGWIVDSTNDRNAFSWTGKNGTTQLTGCSGVLAHNNGAVVIPQLKNWITSKSVFESRFYGNRGDGTIEELATIGDAPAGANFAVIVAGSTAATASKYGIIGRSGSSPGVYGSSVSYNGVIGLSTTGHGVVGLAGTLVQAGSGCGAYFASTVSGKAAINLGLTTTGSQTITAGTPWVPSAPGFYNMIDVTGATATGVTLIELFISGAWQTMATVYTGTVDCCIYCDGANVRVRNTDATNQHTIQWQRF
jgi:hypothetical protein